MDETNRMQAKEDRDVQTILARWDRMLKAWWVYEKQDKIE